MIPKRLLPHRITYKPFLGNGADGDAFGAPVADVPARVEFVRQLVRDKDGREVTSTATIYLQPTSAPNVDSVITTPDGVERPVISRAEFAGRSVIELVALQV